MPSASATPWDGVPPADITPAQALVAEAHRAAYSERHAPLEGEAAFFDGYERGACPLCGSPLVRRHGRDARGVRRWLCRSCGRTFTPTTGTIFEGHRIPVSDWCKFVIQLLSFDSLAEVTRSNRRSPTTAPYWLAKLFLVLDGVQGAVVLSGRVQIDETFYPVPAAELERDGRGRVKPGFSRNKLCMACAADGRGRSVAVPCGRGKPERPPRARGLRAPHRAWLHARARQGGRPQRAGVRAGARQQGARLLARLPGRDNPLRDVNRLRFLLKAFLTRHGGFGRSGLEGWLNVFSVIANPPGGTMAKAALVLDRAVASPRTLRYRDFYGRGPAGGHEAGLKVQHCAKEHCWGGLVRHALASVDE